MSGVDPARLRVLDLFSGLGGWSAAFKARGHDVVTVELEQRFGSTICADILTLSADDLRAYGPFDVVLASPPCEAFSVASIGHHWTGGRRAYEPKTQHAVTSKRLVEHTLSLIADLKPRYWWLENPRGLLRKMPFMEPHTRTTVTYCAYGETRMKPTDLWGVWPSTWAPRPMCRNGSPCHEAAPRGARTGTQGVKGAAARAVVPYELSLDVCRSVAP